MAKIYLVRHQAGGVLHDYPFAAPPSEKQLAALGKLCFQSHGAAHPKSKEPYWLKAVEVDVLGPNEVPAVPERSLSVANAAGAAEFSVTGTGTVTPGEK